MSQKITNDLLKYTKRNLSSLEKQMVGNYQAALNNIRTELLKLDEKGSLTQTDILKYGRLESLNNLIVTEMKQLGIDNYKLINYERKSTYLESYKRFYEESGLKIPSINADFIKQSIENNLLNQPFKDSLSINVKKNASAISSKITQGLTQGLTVTDVAKMVKEYVNNDAKKAITVARTETLRALSEGQIEATNRLIDKGFKVKKIWLYSYHVKGSRDWHEDMNGKEADEDGMFHVVNPYEGEILTNAPRMSGIASEDLNCRCSYYNEVESQ